MPSYFGVNGFSKPYEVRCALNFLAEVPTTRKFMMGVVATEGSIRGKIPSGRYRKIVPANAEFETLMSPHPQMLNLVHYSSSRRNVETLFDDLRLLHIMCGPNLSGFQLNLDWPSLDELRRYRDEYGGESYIVLQIAPPAIESVGGKPVQVARRIREYDDVIDAILFDLSVGAGVPLNASVALPFLDAIQDECKVEIGTAGGLGPTTMHLIEPVLERHPRVNFDAETSVQLPEGGVSIEALHGFIKEAGKLC